MGVDVAGWRTANVAVHHRPTPDAGSAPPITQPGNAHPSHPSAIGRMSDRPNQGPVKVNLPDGGAVAQPILGWTSP